MNLYLNSNDKIKRYIVGSIFNIHMISYKNGGKSKDELLKELDECIYEDDISFLYKQGNKYIFKIFDEDSFHYLDTALSKKEVEFILLISSDRERYRRWYTENIINKIKVKNKI